MEIIQVWEQNAAPFEPLTNANYFRQIRCGMLEALGAVYDGVAAGIIVLDLKREGVFLIHDIFVAPQYRQKGVAAGLLSRIMQLAMEKGATVLTSFDDTPESFVERMLCKYGFEIRDSHAKNYIIPMESIQTMTVFDRIKYTDEVRPIALINPVQWKRFCRNQAQMGNIFPITSYSSEAEEELNLCIRTEMGIAGCVTGGKINEEVYELSYAYVRRKYAVLLMPLIGVFRDNLLHMAQSSACLHITAVNQTSAKMIEKLMPEGAAYTSTNRKTAFWSR